MYMPGLRSAASSAGGRLRLMLLRSLLLVLAAAAAVATGTANGTAVWSDVVIAVTYNVTTAPYRPFNAPEYVYYLPLFTWWIDPSKGLAVAEHPYSYFNFMAAPSLLYLRGLIYTWSSYVPYTVGVSFYTPGHLVGGSNFTVGSYPAGPFSICSGRYYYTWAYWVRKAGNYTVRSEGGTLSFIEEGTCAIYAVVEGADWHGFPNYTTPRALITVFLMPTGKRGDIEGAWRPFARPVETWINNTAHLYTFRYDFFTIADGWYIANRTRIPTVVGIHSGSRYYGPIHFSVRAEAITWPYVRTWATFFTIGADPGDGAVLSQLPVAFYGRAAVGYVANETAGYFEVRREWMPLTQQAYWAGASLMFFLQRYSLTEIAAEDDLYVWNTRTMACPLYASMSASPPPEAEFVRLDRGREFVLCNNRTDALYAALRLKATGRYVFLDLLKPNRCVRMRYDGAYNASDTALYFFTTPQDYCLQNPAYIMQGGNYSYGYVWYLMPDWSMTRGPPISPDALFEEMWRRLLEMMARQLNETKNTVQQWLQHQQNLTKGIENYYRSLPQHTGTIRIESSTSVWLQSVLNEISRYTVPSLPPPGGGFAPAPLPGASSLSAAAAAAAVATAWAASRRSLAAAAFLAGFAVLAAALFVYYLYGASVTAGLVLAAVALMSIGAAAAWFRRAED